MIKRSLLFVWFMAELFSCGGAKSRAQNEASSIKVNVVLVQLSVAVTDHKGNYVTGLKPEDFEVIEDKIPEKIANFDEGNAAPRTLIDFSSGEVSAPAPAAAAPAAPSAASAVKRPDNPM